MEHLRRRKEKQSDQDFRGIRLSAAPALAGAQRFEVELGHDVYHKTSEIFGRQAGVEADANGAEAS